MEVMCIKDGFDTVFCEFPVICGNDYTVTKECLIGYPDHHYHLMEYNIGFVYFDPKLFRLISDIDESKAVNILETLKTVS